jgi:succinate dehydrogenase / fumarate reductase, cytochrome b subunit
VDLPEGLPPPPRRTYPRTMTTTTAHDAPAGPSMTFVRGKLASLLAVAPLGVWTIVHVWNNLSAYQGAAAWQHDVTGYEHPLSLVVTSVVVLAPLVLHTIWGIGRLFTSRPNNLRYGYFENLKYLLQRLSAVGVLAFLGAHLWLAFLHPRLVEHRPEPFQSLAAEMHHNLPTLIVYLLGTLGVAYHLGNGLFDFAWSWGIATSRRSLRGFQTASVLLFVVLLAMSWGAVYGLWSAGGAFGVPVD